MREYLFCPNCQRSRTVYTSDRDPLLLLLPVIHEHVFIAGEMWEVWFFWNEETGEMVKERISYRCISCGFEWDGR